MVPVALVALIAVVLTLSVLVLLMRSDMKRMQRGVMDLARINVQTNLYAQSAIAKTAAPHEPRESTAHTV